jgi:hypothetical protein
VNKLELHRGKSTRWWGNWGQGDCRCVSEASFITQLTGEYLGDAPFVLETLRICENAIFERPLGCVATRFQKGLEVGIGLLRRV